MNGAHNKSQAGIDSANKRQEQNRCYGRLCRLRHSNAWVAIVLILSSGLWLGGISSIRAGNEDIHLPNSRTDTTLFIPAMMAPLDEVQGLSTPLPISTIAPTSEPTITPIGTPTSLPSTIIRFEGNTDQGQPILIEASPDLLAITKFQMDAQIICDTTSGLVSIDLVEQLGYDVVNNRFQIRSESPGGNVNVFMGMISGGGAQMNGTWSVWLDGAEPFQPCSNKGDWSATVSTFSRSRFVIQREP